MSIRSMSSFMAICAVLVAAAATAGDTSRPAAAAPDASGERHVQRIVVHADGEDAAVEEGEEGDDEFAWFGEGEDDVFVGGAEQGGERRVIVKRIQRGPGGMGGPGGPGMMGGPGGMGGPGMHRGMGGPGGGRMGRMAHRFAMVDLTDAQRDKMRDIHERQMRRGIQARADLQLARMDMQKLMRSDKPEAAALNAQVDRMAKMRADQAKAHIGAFLEARALLTPEQLKKFNEGPGKGPGMKMMHGPGMRMMHGGAPGAGKPDSQ